MSKLFVEGDVFEMTRDQIDVTSMHRPAVGWVYNDTHGHRHEWYADGKPATAYYPFQKYDVPSLIWVKDGVAYDEDGEPYDIGHNECRECGEHIEPRYTADDCQQFIPGLARCWINGESVTHEEFMRRLPEQYRPK